TGSSSVARTRPSSSGESPLRSGREVQHRNPLRAGTPWVWIPLHAATRPKRGDGAPAQPCSALGSSTPALAFCLHEFTAEEENDATTRDGGGARGRAWPCLSPRA